MRVYERRLVGNQALVVPVTGTLLAAVDFVSEAILKRLAIAQSGGAGKAATVSLWSAPVIAAVDSLGNPVDEIDAAVYGHDEIYRVTDDIAVVAGTPTVVLNLDHLFTSLTGARSPRGGGLSNRRLYVKIVVTSPTEETTWDVAIGAVISE